jgi:hypothetical protein
MAKTHGKKQASILTLLSGKTATHLPSAPQITATSHIWQTSYPTPFIQPFVSYAFPPQITGWLASCIDNSLIFHSTQNEQSPSCSKSRLRITTDTRGFCSPFWSGLKQVVTQLFYNGWTAWE